ncbi:hypothetical protein ODR38_05890 [Pediococcus acidilactici]
MKILFVITGGIAEYKVVEAVRYQVKAGNAVKVVMTGLRGIGCYYNIYNTFLYNIASVSPPAVTEFFIVLMRIKTC